MILLQRERKENGVKTRISKYEIRDFNRKRIDAIQQTSEKISRFEIEK